jgi:hypothetical protein
MRFWLDPARTFCINAPTTSFALNIVTLLIAMDV